MLNLPKTITKTSTGETLNYTYDATGQKLRKVFGSSIRDYIGGIEYSNNTIEFIQTEEGRAIPGSSYTYEYMIKDHLGNTRAMVKQNGEISQVRDYYAFGLEMNPGNAKGTSPNNLYRYNGKEKQTELSLDQLDYGARFYDPVIGRWNVIDPLAEQYRRWSPYNYAVNNPVRFIDPDGMGVNDFVKRKDGSIYWDKNANDQGSTKSDEKYLGKTLKFEFNSYIDAKSWDGPLGKIATGDKLTTTVYVTGNENAKGELTSVSAGKHVEIGPTPTSPFDNGRDYYPGLGKDQNKFSATAADGGFNVGMEQHGSVSRSEEFGMNAMGYNIVNVAQKLDVNISKQGNVSISSATDVFPSATLSVNGSTIMKYNQPSFIKTHTSPLVGSSSPTSGSLPIHDFSYKPAIWYKR